MLKESLNTPKYTNIVKSIDAQRFFKENRGKDLFPEKTARMKKLLENVK